jgi:hypothetical protein
MLRRPGRLEVAMRSHPIRLARFAAGALFALACSASERPAAPPAAEAPAATAPQAAIAAPEASAPTSAQPPQETRRGRTITPDGQVFEAEYGGESQLPTDFPSDVPIYGAARPMSSMSSVGHGTIVNLRTADSPESVFAWYKEQMPSAGWKIESESSERGRSLLGLRKGNRVASLVITGVPEFTSILLSLRDDR